jgi:hypothetical protein
MTRGILANAGERLGIDCAVGWVGALLEEASDGGLLPGDPADGTVLIRVEAARDAFDTAAWEPVARGAHGRRDTGSLVLRNLLSTGFDLRVDPAPAGGDGAARFRFTYRWRPGRRERAMALALRSRFHLLARSALLRYPALWAAGTRGRVPLHASACTAGNAGVALLAGPGGVGKSTLVAKELAAGGNAICDNVCVCDGAGAWGVVEPLRVEGGSGRRMQHGRREARMPGRVPSLTPDRIVVLRRGTGPVASVQPCSPEAATRALVAGTYMAQELRRYWAFAATLALGTGVGPAHPPVAEVAAALARDLPATLITLPNKPGPRLAELLEEAKTWT